MIEVLNYLRLRYTAYDLTYIRHEKMISVSLANVPCDTDRKLNWRKVFLVRSTLEIHLSPQPPCVTHSSAHCVGCVTLTFLHTCCEVGQSADTLSCLVAKSHPTLAALYTVARQALLSMGVPRHEYWSGLPFPPPGHLPDPGTEPPSPALAGEFFTTEPQGKLTHWKSPELGEAWRQKEKGGRRRDG